MRGKVSRTSIVAGSVAVLLLLWLGVLYSSEPDPTRLNFVHRIVLAGVVTDWEKLFQRYDPEDKAIIPLDTLLISLTFWQKPLVTKILQFTPEQLGVKASFVSLSAPQNLIRIVSVTFSKSTTGRKETGVQFLPSSVYDKFKQMSEALKKDVGNELLIDSGYRSPGRQAFLFFYYLAHSNDYSLRENIKWIMMPGYSEHGSPNKTAIDFSTEEGINGFSDNQQAEDFEKTEEYRWLSSNAGKYGFKLSYPKGNASGAAYEPWHWHYEPEVTQATEMTELK